MLNGRPVDRVGGVTSSVDPDSLPRDFSGREAEIAKVRHFVQNCRYSRKVIVIHGSPLVGKTSLAHRLGTVLV
jgi:hypothetical protein